MEKEIWKVQPEINYHHQVIENVPAYTSEIQTEPANEQVVEENQHQETVDNNENAELVREVTTLNENELKELELPECKEYSSEFLNQLLWSEAKQLTDVTAKEEAVVWALQCHMQDLDENQEKLEKEISKLESVKEEVAQKLTTEEFNYSQIVTQIEEINQHKEILNQKHNMLKETCETILQEIKTVEQADEREHQKYQLQKLELLAAIKKEEENM